MTDLDPRTGVTALRDDAPVVLLPLRLETRFRPARLRPRRPAELWVRVYPDDCWVDTFEPGFTASELDSVRVYWRARLATEDESAWREAWRLLVRAHGAGRATYLIEQWRPTTVGEVDAAELAAFEPRRGSWTAAARVHGLPQRLRLVATRGGAVEIDQLGEPVPDPLVVGPDPSGSAGLGIHLDDDGHLVVPDPLRWLVDFDTAVTSGMAFRIPLSADQAERGFDRLFVLGVRLGGDEHDGARALTTLLDHQRWSTPGLELLAHGAPTNNTDGAVSPFRRFDEPDVTFSAVHRPAAPSAAPEDWRRKPDGQWFTELLGLDPEAARHLVRAEGTDQIEARAMSRLLWPGTFGYYVDAMLAVPDAGRGPRGVLSSAAETALKAWATRYVVGRGTLPAIRVGRQPYGLVPTTAFSRLSWTTHGAAVADRDQLPFVAGLHRVLEVMRRDWIPLAGGAAHLTRGHGDAAERLAAVLGLQPASVQFHQRHADTPDRHRVLFGYLGDELVRRHQAFVAAMTDATLRLLATLGADLPAAPEVLTKLFLDSANRLDGPVVDDVPLSEVDHLRVDYLRWLRATAASSLDALRTVKGLTPRPRALLFLLAKFALERAYAEAADDVLVRLGGVDPASVTARRLEPPFVHVAAAGRSESRWLPLYEPAPRVTRDDAMPLHRFVTRELRRGRLPASSLADQLDALDALDIPTARLERAFVEHLDTGSYRLDAWLGGLVAFQLQQMRFPVPTRPARTGTHLGAYGWLEEVRPRSQALERVTITDADVAATFDDPTASPIVRDPANGGFVAAPTLDHAATASVLRAGYLAAADASNPGPLAVNLSSERVRLAQVLLDGVRAGQSLGALLGYQFERGLHDRHELPQLHAAIYALRAAFPLRANRLAETVTDPGTPAEAIEARNVVDGQRLLDHVRAGHALPAMPAVLAAAVEQEVDRLRDLYDAVSDLALAESVHQLVLGNHDRAGAMLDAFGRGGLPPEPDVVRAPRSGFAITHRLVLHLDPDAPAGSTPRSIAEPSLNAWLGAVLPPADRLGCLVRAVDPPTGAVIERVVTQAELGWEPIDLLMQLDVEADQVMSALDNAVVDAMSASAGLRPDARVVIAHAAEVPGVTTFFQVGPVLRSLRSLLLNPTLLRPTDVAAPAGGATPPQTTATPLLARARVATPLADLLTAGAAVDELAATIESDRDAAAAGIDAIAAAFTAVTTGLAGFGLVGASSAQVRSALAAIYVEIVATATEVASHMADRLARFDVGLAAFDALPAPTTETVRVRHLVDLERLVSTVATAPAPPVPALRAAVVAKRGVLAARKSVVSASVTGHTGVRALLDSVAGAIAAPSPSLAELTGETPDLQPLERSVHTVVDDVARQLAALRAEIDGRVAAASAALAAHDAATDAHGAVEALRAGGRALFGEAFPMVPTLGTGPAAAADLAAALGGSDALIAPLVAAGRDDPTGDWFHGVARVRERVRALETLVLLADPLARRCGGAAPGDDVLGLMPLQLPHQPGAPWMALELPPGTVPERDIVCHTAVGAITDPGRLCAVVLDEWPEVVALPERSAGLAVHFDRPSSEPPQAWLVVTPATWDGSWSWDDLVGALDDTLDLARLRAVEPDHLDGSAYAPLLPATVLPVAPFQISIMVNLAMNTDRFAELRED